jgi:hypothetical protein
MGSLYRSRHELVFVFMQGFAAHINNIELGRYGRDRSNLWDYPSQNVLNGTAKSKLALHPTPKPVGLVADAIRDCSHRNGIILDPFGGAGSTLIRLAQIFNNDGPNEVLAAQDMLAEDREILDAYAEATRSRLSSDVELDPIPEESAGNNADG